VAMNRHEPGHESYTLAEAVLESAPQRDAAWWVEWFRVKLQRMGLYYWQNRPDDMAEIAGQIGLLIEQHGAVTQRTRYLSLLALIALRRDHYFYSGDAITYTGEALAVSLETGNLGEIADRQFTHGFSHLWSDHLNEAETHLQIARKMTEQNGDLSILARALAYLTVVYRIRGDIERVQEYATYSLQIAREARMPQYTGMARAQCAWLAWRVGNLAETKQQAQAAIADWGGLGSAQTIVPFRWFALFPLMGVALQEEDIEQAAHCAKHMTTPPQQRLPDDLADLLERAVAAWEQGRSDVSNDLLQQAFQLAQELHYV
jgi:eukaryotic-like serine/threonine-protein kinase